MCLTTAANQVGKSVMQIWKDLDWATDITKWDDLWQTDPNLFWYLYPTKDVVSVEWKTKWKQWMPRGDLAKSQQWGWKLDADKNEKEINGIHFNSGIFLDFKTYAQNVHALQTASVYKLSCFVKGTLITTSDGLKDISEIRCGDYVYSHTGLNKVIDRQVSLKPVRIIEFTNGSKITVTDEHPFFTFNKGFVRADNLQMDDTLCTIPFWKTIEELYRIKEKFIKEASTAMTTVQSFIIGVIPENSCMLRYGKAFMERVFQRDTASTIKISILWIIIFQIWKYLHAANIREFTKLKNGKTQRKDNISAKSAEKNSLQKHHRKQLLNFALKNAAEKLNIENVLIAAKITKLARTQIKSIAHCCVSTKEVVYNLTVEKDHTYFSQGLQVHNCDEELPEELWDEIIQRISGTKGYYSSVFTATRNQQMWLRAMEGKGHNELFPDAFKQQISKYDCLTFDDGSSGLYTEEQIENEIANCRNQAQKDRRIFGKFASEEGRLYWAFDPTRHYMKPQPIPEDWDIYSGTDIGSGLKSHPAAIIFIAVRPDYQLAWVFKGRRFDDMQTTAGDILREYRKLRGSLKPTLQCYDWQAKDFSIIAERDGEAFMKAEKSQDLGQETINTLFQHNMMYIFDDDPELAKLGSELLTVMKDTPKPKAKDDACDALRFASTLVPWNWIEIKGNPEKKKEKPKGPPTPEELLQKELEERRNRFHSPPPTEGWGDLQDEIDYWNEQY